MKTLGPRHYVGLIILLAISACVKTEKPLAFKGSIPIAGELIYQD